MILNKITEEKEAELFFNEVHQAFQKTVEASRGSVDRFYRIAGHAIRLHFAGPALLSRMTPALEHLA